MKVTGRVSAGFVLLLALLCGCGGSGSSGHGNSQSGLILVTDPQQLDGSYYDVWTFVPSRSGQAEFTMDSASIVCQVILKDAQGNTLKTVSAPGTDDDDNFDGEADLTWPVIQGQTYTLTTTTVHPNITGEYDVFWPFWVQLTIPGD